MKRARNSLGLAVAALWLAAGITLIAQDNGKDHQVLTGVVSNTHCGLKHSAASSNEAGCVNMCVKNNNASYALVAMGKLYTLQGDAAQFAKFAGQQVTVTGHLAQTTMQVEKVEASK